MLPEEYRKKIEYEILEIIEERLKAGDIDCERAKAISVVVLNKLHPPLTLEQIYEIVPLLDDDFPELTPVVVQVLKDQDSQIVDLVTNKIHELLKKNQITEANGFLDNVLNDSSKD